MILKKTLVVALLAFIILRIPSFFEPHWYADEGIYAATTFGIEQGKQLYVDIWDNKPPLIYYLYGLGDSSNRITIIKMINLIAGLTTLIGLYALLKKFLRSQKIIALSIFLAVFLLGTSFIEGNIANAENLFLPFIVWAYVLLNNKKPFYVVAGFLLGLGFLIKFHPFFNFFALVIYLFLTRAKIKSQLLFIVGFLLPILAQFIQLFFYGNLRPALETIFLNNYGYTQTFNVGIHTLWFKTIVLLVCTTILLFMYRKEYVSKQILFFLLIGFFELYSVYFGGRKYYHYLLQVVPAATLGFGLLLHTLTIRSLKNKLVSIGISCAFLIGALWFFNTGGGYGYAYPVHSYYLNFFAYVTQRAPYFIDNSDMVLEKMRFQLNTYPYGSRYIYTTNPWIYDVLEITPITKLIASYHRTFIGVDIYMQDIKNAYPDIIVVDLRADQSSELNEYLRQNYLKAEKIEYYQFWLKKYQIAQRS